MPGRFTSGWARENPSVTRFQSSLAGTHTIIGVVQGERSGPTEAQASFQQARAIWERLAHDHASVTEFQGNLATIYHNIGMMEQKKGLPAEALASYEKARPIVERLARENPSGHLDPGPLGLELQQHRRCPARNGSACGGPRVV